jgi:diguanylate cyclase
MMTTGTAIQPAVLARGALRRLAQGHLEPTPENFAAAYREEAGTAIAWAPGRSDESPSRVAWPALVERLVRNLERGGKQWTASRRKESLYRVLDSSRSDESRLAQRVQALMKAWESDHPLDGVETAGLPLENEGALARGHELAAAPSAQQERGDDGLDRGAQELVGAFNRTIAAGLEGNDTRGAMIAGRLETLVAALGQGRAAPDVVEEVVQACGEARRWFEQRHELVRQLNALCSEMSRSLVDLVEDESWARGQCDALRQQLSHPLDVRSLRAAGALLADTRTRQLEVKRERQATRAAIKQLLAGMIGEAAALQEQAGGFESAIEQHAAAVEEADSLEGLTAVVQAMLADTRGMRAAVGAANERLRRDSDRAATLESRVRDLELELRRISDEASTDALTQVANRRGLERMFADECARASASGAPLAVGLLDIDNFKKLNDRLGHAAGDHALKALASTVQERLRPEDKVARFGGEEFVVLLRGLSLEQAQESLTRLQRSLTAGLFLHEGEEVLVTFSAGVTLWRPGDALEATIDRADSGLYEAKRTGKNRTCTA